jgi:hypothetical protein
MARKKKSVKPNAATLARANRFNLSALASNRQGRLTNGQTFRFVLRLASMLLSIIAALAFGIACIVLAVVVVMPKQALAENWVSLLGVALLSLLGLVWIFDAINHTRKQTIPLLRDVTGGGVTMEEGIVSRDYDDHSYASLWHNLLTWVLHSFAEEHAKHIEWFSGVHYYVLNGQQFNVSQKGYTALTKESPWRLYYASHSKRLVNIEPAPDNINL